MLMTSQPQQNRARRIARTLRAVPTNAGTNINLNRVIGTEGLPHLDPFLVFDELNASRFSAIAGGFPDQTCRGFDSVTYVIKGRLKYTDNTGRHSVTESGGLQWLTSGRGLTHSEMPELADGEIQAFQFWLNLPRSEKMQAPAFRTFDATDIPAVIFTEAEVRLIAGRFYGLQGPVTPQATRAFIAEVILKPEGEITLPMDEGHNGFVYVYEGGGAIGQVLLSSGQAGILESGNVLNIAAGQAGARLMVMTALPLNEPIIRHGPFVMTAHEEIKQAFTDYQNGLF
jgi:redox-sensitive bicupin YhaK (pirin superfamily)